MSIYERQDNLARVTGALAIILDRPYSEVSELLAAQCTMLNMPDDLQLAYESVLKEV